MYSKTCEGCGKGFEALKLSRRWCSDACGRRTRRHTAIFGDQPVRPVNPVTYADNPVSYPDNADTIAYLRTQIAFVRAFDPAVVLPVDVVERLLSFEDEGCGGTHLASTPASASEADYEAVERVLVERVIARLEEFQAGSDFEAAQAAMALLGDFWDDKVDDRVVSVLASALRDALRRGDHDA